MQIYANHTFRVPKNHFLRKGDYWWITTFFISRKSDNFEKNGKIFIPQESRTERVKGAVASNVPFHKGNFITLGRCSPVTPEAKGH